MTPVCSARLGIQRTCLTFTLGALCACAGRPRDPVLDSYPRDVVGFTSVTYYDIHGSTVAELHADMRRQGPKYFDTSFVAETRSPMRWEWHTRPEGIGSCSMKDAHVFMNARILLPRWTPPADTEPGLVAEWTRFLAALEKHEAGHKDISAKAASDLTQRLMALNGPCSTIADRASNLGRAMSARVEDEQRQYDAQTRHGIAQGTSLGLRRRGPPAQPGSVVDAIPVNARSLSLTPMVEASLSATSERAWRALPPSYAAVGLAVSQTDSVSHHVVSGATVSGKIGERALSTLFDCGAPASMVLLIVATQVSPTSATGSVVKISSSATVHSATAPPLVCRSNGTLEGEILKALLAELAR